MLYKKINSNNSHKGFLEDGANLVSFRLQMLPVFITRKRLAGNFGHDDEHDITISHLLFVHARRGKVLYGV